MTTFSGKVASFSKSGKTFLIDPASITFADGSETQLINAGNVVRGLVDDWRFGGVPDIGDVVLFTGNVVFRDKSARGEILAMPVVVSTASVVEQHAPLELTVCKGDESVEPLPQQVNTAMDEEDAAINIAMSDVVAGVARFLGWLFKTRRVVRTP